MSKGISQENAKAVGIIVVVIAVVLIAAYVVKKFFGGVSDLTQKIGLSDSPEVVAAKTKINQANSGGASSYWTPQYYKDAPGGAHLITVSTAQKLAQQIKDAYGFISYLDSPEEAFAAFKELPAKSAVSFLAEQFYQMYDKDLLAWLTIYSDTDKDKTVLGNIISYCDSLPSY